MKGRHWFPIALGELGVREVAGDGDNPRVVEYHAATTLRSTQDETPWCSAFVNWCMSRAGVTPTGSAMARSWLAWGAAWSLETGAVAVLSRGTNPAQGHVGFVVGWDAESVWLLGGNQSDAVTVARFPLSRLLAVRWPDVVG